MKRFRNDPSVDSDSVEELNRDRIGAETVLNQRLTLFLVVFAVVIVSVLNAQKKIFFLSLLFAGLVICWVLAYIVVTSAKKVGYLVKEINANDPVAKKIDRKGSGRSVRFLLGYFIPVFCSLLLTVAFLTGALGFIDPYLWPTSINTATVENKLKEIGTEINKQIEPPKDRTAGHFKNIDSVILLSKPITAEKKNASAKQSTSAQIKSSSDKFSSDFKNVDSVIAQSNTGPQKSKINARDVPKKAAPLQSSKLDAELKSLDSEMVKLKSGQAAGKTKEIKTDTTKTKIQKKIISSQHFENIDSVISKPK